MISLHNAIDIKFVLKKQIYFAHARRIFIKHNILPLLHLRGIHIFEFDRNISEGLNERLNAINMMDFNEFYDDDVQNSVNIEFRTDWVMFVFRFLSNYGGIALDYF